MEIAQSDLEREHNLDLIHDCPVGDLQVVHKNGDVCVDNPALFTRSWYD